MRIQKYNFPDTVVWNPWIEQAKEIPDFGDDEYPNMVCVESGHVSSPVILLPGTAFEASQILQVMWVEGGAAGTQQGVRRGTGRSQNAPAAPIATPQPSTSGTESIPGPSGAHMAWPSNPWLSLNNVYVGDVFGHHRLLLDPAVGRKASPEHQPPCNSQTSCSICSLNLWTKVTQGLRRHNQTFQDRYKRTNSNLTRREVICWGVRNVLQPCDNREL